MKSGTKSFLSLLSLFLIFSLVLTTLLLGKAPVDIHAEEIPVEKQADTNTMDKYMESLGDGSSTRYDGRVWTDKTVSEEDLMFSGNVNGEQKEYKIVNDSDFLVSYSALATSSRYIGQADVPLDTVLILDFSPKMGGSSDYKLNQMLSAAMNAVNTLMEANEQNRVAIVAYSNGAEIMLPLAHYEKESVSYRIEKKGSWLLEYYDVYFNYPGGTSSYTVDHLSSGVDKYTQFGMYTGMNLLMNADTTVEINGQTVTRVPTAVLLSEGEPKLGSTNIANPSVNPEMDKGIGGSDSRQAQTFATLLTASYMKHQVTQHYGRDVGIYTIGVDPDSADSSWLAREVMNPKANAGQGTTFGDAWTNYQSGSVTLPDAGGLFGNGDETFYYNSGLGITSIQYNDAYYEVSADLNWNEIFEDVVTDITTSVPQVPTETDPEHPASSGYITYKDPIGEYMEVKDIKEILWSGIEFTEKSKTTESDGTDVYAFTGSVSGEVYGEHDLSEIVLRVSKDQETGKQTITVKIPASCIPLRVNTVRLNKEGSVESNESNGAYPIRIFYTVGLKDGLRNEDGRVDASQLTEEYVKANSDGNGNISFFSNLYTGQEKQDPDDTSGTVTVGDTTVEFEPADTNPFYFFQQPVPIYVDEALTIRAQEIDPDSQYYFQITYYEGLEKKQAVVRRSGALMEKYAEKDEQGVILPEGTPRVGNLLDFTIGKDTGTNLTGTADSYYYPTFVYRDGAQDPHEGNFKVFLGNNGRMTLPLAGGDITVGKTVDGDSTEGSFVFDVVLQNETAKLGSYLYTKTDALGQTKETGTVSAAEDGKAVFTPDSGTGPQPLTLQNGETATIQNLPYNTGFSVTEQEPAHEQFLYTTSVRMNGGQPEETREAKGVLTGTDMQVQYTNTASRKIPFQFFKVDGTTLKIEEGHMTGTPEGLGGAEFTLYRYTGSSWDSVSDKVEETFEEADWEKITSVTSSEEEGAAGMTDLGYLRKGNYRLTETKAPGGYALPEGQWNIIAGDTLEISGVGRAPAFAQDENGTYYLPNNPLLDPPLTGGRGVLMFLAGGAVLMLAGAGVGGWRLAATHRKRRK